MTTIRDKRNRTVLGVLANDKNYNQIVVGCVMCDGEYLSLSTFEKHVSTCHNGSFRSFQTTPNEQLVKIETIDLSSDDDEIAPALPAPEMKQALLLNENNCKNASNNKMKIQEEFKEEPQPSTSSASRVVSGNGNIKCESSFKQPILKCTFCSKSFLRLLKLNLHIHKCKKVSPNRKCEYCGKIFKTATTKRNHISRLHKSEVPFRCKSCLARYTNIKDLTKHIQRAHANGTIVNCKSCKKSFPSKFELNLHIRKTRCGVKVDGNDSRIRFECYICLAQASTHFALNQHYKKIHHV